MINFQNVVFILAIYFILFLVIQGFRHFPIKLEERKTFITLSLLWATSVFGGNFLFYKLGIMSFTPWALNFLHCFVWIALVLTYLFVTTRFNSSILRQALYFIVFSFIVKYAEKIIFNSWEHDHFFWIFKGNFAYILGWSIMDGLYPFISIFGLRILGKRMTGLIVD